MAGENKKIHHENKEALDPNPLSMITPSIIGTPLGMLPILPVPSLDVKTHKKNPDKKDNEDRLP